MSGCIDDSGMLYTQHLVIKTKWCQHFNFSLIINCNFKITKLECEFEKREMHNRIGWLQYFIDSSSQDRTKIPKQFVTKCHVNVVYLLRLQGWVHTPWWRCDSPVITNDVQADFETPSNIHVFYMLSCTILRKDSQSCISLQCVIGNARIDLSPRDVSPCTKSHMYI